jgi:hypothetical protein
MFFNYATFGRVIMEHLYELFVIMI